MKIKRDNLLLFLGLIAISTSYSEGSKISDERVRPEFESQRKSSSQPSAIDHRDEVRLTNQDVTLPSERFLNPSRGSSSGNYEVANHSSAPRGRKGKRKGLTVPKLTKRISEPYPLDVEKDGDDPFPQDREPKITLEKKSDDSSTTDKSVEIPETYKYDSVRITEKQNNSNHTSKRKIKKRRKFNPIKKSEEAKSVISLKHSNDWLVSDERSEDILVPNVTVNPSKTNAGNVSKYINNERQGKEGQVQNSTVTEMTQTIPSISWEDVEEQRKPKLEAINYHNSTISDKSTQNEKESGLKTPGSISPFEKNKKRQKKIKKLRKRLQNKNSTIPAEVSSNSPLVTEEKISNDTTLLRHELHKDSLALNRIHKETDKDRQIDIGNDSRNLTEIESSSEFPFVKTTEYSKIDYKNAQIPEFQEIDEKLQTKFKFHKENLKSHDVPENSSGIDSNGNGYYLLSFNYKGEKADKPKDIIKLSPIITKKGLVKKAHTSPEKKISSTKKQASERGKITRIAKNQQDSAKEKHPHVKKFDFSKRHRLHPDEDVEVEKEAFEPDLYEDYGDIEKVSRPVVNFKRKKVKKSKEPLWKPLKSEVRAPEKKSQSSWDADKTKTNRDYDHETHFVEKNNGRSPYPNKKDNVPWTNQKPSNPKEKSSSQLKDSVIIDVKPHEYDHVLRSKIKPIIPSNENGKYYIHMFKKVGDFSLENHDPSSDTFSRNDGYMSSIKLRWNDDDRRAQVETSVDSRMQPFELIMKHDDPFSSSNTHTVSLGVTKQGVNDDMLKKSQIHENVAERQSARKSVEAETIYRRKRSSFDRNKHFFTSHFEKGAVKPVVNSTYEKNFPYRSLIQNQDKISPSESSFNPQLYGNSNKQPISRKDVQDKHPEIRSYYLKPSSAEEAKKFASEFRDKEFIKSFPFSAYQKPARQRETKKVEIFRAYQLPNRPPPHKSNPINFYTSTKELKHTTPLPRNTNVRSLTYPRKNTTRTFNSGLYGSPSETKIAKSAQPNFNSNNHGSNITKYLHREEEPKTPRGNPFFRETFSAKTKLNLEMKPAANERIPIRREFYHKFKHVLRPNLGIQNRNGDLNSRDKIYEKDNFRGRPDLAGKDEFVSKTIAHDFNQQAGSQQLHQLPSTNFGSYLRSKDRGYNPGKTRSIKRVNQLEDTYGLHESSDSYPRYNSIPKTHFTCNEHKAGYYADPETGCQVFHLCQGGGEKHSFLCPNETLFNQLLLVCDWHNKVNCEESVSFYSVNDRIYRQHSAPKEYRNPNHNYNADLDNNYHNYGTGLDNNYHNRNSQQSRSTFIPDRKRGIEKLTSETTLHSHHDSSEALETIVSLPNSSDNDDQIDSDFVLMVKPESDAKVPGNDTLQSYRKPVYNSISDTKNVPNNSSFKNNTSNPKGFHYYKEDEYLILHDIAPPENNEGTSPKRFEHEEIKNQKRSWNPVKLRKSTYEQSKGMLRQNKPIDPRDTSIKKSLFKKYSNPVNYETIKRINPTRVKYGYTKEQENLPTFKKPTTLEKKNISLIETGDKHSASTESVKSKPSKLPLIAQHIKRKPLFPHMTLKTKNASVSKNQTSPLRSEAITKENKMNIRNNSGKDMKTPQIELPRHAISNQDSEHKPKTPKTSEKYKNHKTDETHVDLVYKYPLSVNIKKNNSSDRNIFGQKKNDSKITDSKKIQLPHFKKPVNNNGEETNKKHHVERKNVDQHLDVSSRIADIFSGIKTIGADVSKILDNKDRLYKNIQITKSIPVLSEPAQKMHNLSLEPFTFDKLLPKTLKVQSKSETIETPVQTVPKFFQDISAEINTKIHMKNVVLDKDKKEFVESKPSNFEVPSATRNNETIAATDLQTDMKVVNRMNEHNRNETSAINEFHPITSNTNVQSHKNDNESERIFSTINIDSKKKSSINGYPDANVRQSFQSSQYPHGYTDKTVSVSKVLYTPSESKESSKGIQYALNPKEHESEISKTVSNHSIFSVQKSHKQSDPISTSGKPALYNDSTQYESITPINSFQRSQPTTDISPTFATTRYNNFNLDSNQDVHKSPENKDSANGKFLAGSRGRHSYMKSLPRRTSKSNPDPEKYVPERQLKKQALSTQENLPAFIFSANPFSKHKILGQNTKTSQNEPMLNHKPIYKTTLPSRERSKPTVKKSNHPPQSENNDSSSSECDESNSRESAELPKTIQLGKNGPYYKNIKIGPVRSHPSGKTHEFIGGKVVRKSPTKQDNQKTRGDGCQNNQGSDQMKQDIVNLEIPQSEQVIGTVGRNPIHDGYKNSPQTSYHQNSGKYVPPFAYNSAINVRNYPGNQQGTVNSEFAGGRQAQLDAERTSSDGRHTLSDQQNDKLSSRLKSKPAIERVLKEQGQLKRPIKLFGTQKKYERVPVTEIAYPNGGTYQNGGYNRPPEPARVALNKGQNTKSSSEESTENTKTSSRSRGTEDTRNSKYASFERAAELEAERMIQSRSPS